MQLPGLSDVSGVADVNLLQCANVLLLRANSHRKAGARPKLVKNEHPPGLPPVRCFRDRPRPSTGAGSVISWKAARVQELRSKIRAAGVFPAAGTQGGLLPIGSSIPAHRGHIGAELERDTNMLTRAT